MEFQEHYISTLKAQRDMANEQIAQLNARLNMLMEENESLKKRIEELTKEEKCKTIAMSTDSQSTSG